MDIEKGALLVKTARKVVEDFLKKETIYVDENFIKTFQDKRGIFTTILTYPSKELRGCIGYVEPIFPLWKGLINSAINAAFNDPRFPPLTVKELDSVIFEVTVLTPPKKIIVKSPEEYLNKIKIGRDGLIIKYGPYSGVLLPQVPVEYDWDVETFLENLCLKAGLPPDAWKTLDVEIYKFEGEIFEEEKPYGRVIKKIIK